jgi:hypothetical protein
MEIVSGEAKCVRSDPRDQIYILLEKGGLSTVSGVASNTRNGRKSKTTNAA